MKNVKLKKIGIILGVILGVLVLTLAVVPFFIDVDKQIRPKIVETIESVADVKADIGKLSLNLFWGVNIGIENLKLTENATKNVLFELKNAKLQIPYLSLLTGTLSVTLKTEQPIIRVTRFRDGSLSVSKIMRSQPAQQTQGEGASSGSGAAALGSRLSFSTDIQKAQLLVNDQVTDFNFKIENLDLKLNNVGINRKFDVIVRTQLNIDNKKDIRLAGSMSFDGATEIRMGTSGFESVLLDSNLDLSSIEVKYAKLINKSKDIPFVMQSKLQATSKDANIDHIKLKVGSFEVLVAGLVKNFAQPELNLTVKSNDLDLSQWKAVVAPLKEFDMDGKLSLDLKATGSAAQPNLNGRFEFKNGSLKVAALKPRVTDLNMIAEMSGQTIRFKNTDLKIGSSDINLDGSVSNFVAPEIDLTVKSKLLNLDEMMLPAAPEKIASTKPAGASVQDIGTMAEAPLAAVRANPTLKNMDLKASARVQKLIVKNATLEDLTADAYFKGLILTIKNASIKIFQGTAKVFMQFDMSNPTPSYQMTADVSGIDINQAVVSQFKDLDKTITGKANGNIIVSGFGLKTTQVKNNLKGSGKFTIKEGAWSGAVPLKKIGERLSKIPAAGEKLGGLKVDDRFKAFNVDFSIQNAAIHIQKALIDTVEANTAIDASGFVDFDQNMRIKGNVLAPVKDVPRDLKTADGRGKIPFELSGKATAPEVEWEKTVQVIAKAYAKDEGKKLLEKGTEKLKEKAGDKVKELFKGIKF
jgi:hypothetical protein